MRMRIQIAGDAMRAFIALVCSMAMPCAVAWADDGANYLGDPVFSIRCDGGKLEASSAHVTLDENEMDVKYSFKNSCADKNVTITIDVPAYGWGGAGNIYPDRSYAGLELLVNGKKAAYAKAQAAYYNGNDVTDMLSAFKIAPNDIADLDRWTFDMTDADRERYQPLMQKGLLSSSGPAWEAKNTYSYAFTATHEKSVTVEYRYTALPGYDYFLRNAKDVYPLRNKNLNWNKLTSAYGGNRSVFILQWIDIPLYYSENMDIKNVTIDVIGDETHTYLIAVLKNNDPQSMYKKNAHISLKCFKKGDGLSLLMLAPM